MSNKDVDLRQAVTDQALYTIQCFVVDQQNELLKDWLNESQERFCSILQQSLQKSHRAKRQLIGPKDEIPYQMGVWEGWLQAFRALYDEESKENDILELAVAKSPNTAKIIRFLYQYGKPICHGELADALEMNYSALTNAMKRVIGCGAVSASRTGRNTRYTLTKAGQQYCLKEMKWEKIIPKSQEIQVMEKLIDLLERNKKREELLTLSPSEKIRIKYGDEYSEAKRLKAVSSVQMGLEREKLIELEPDDSNDSPYAPPDKEHYALIYNSVLRSRTIL